MGVVLESCARKCQAVDATGTKTQGSFWLVCKLNTGKKNKTRYKQIDHFLLLVYKVKLLKGKMQSSEGMELLLCFVSIQKQSSKPCLASICCQGLFLRVVLGPVLRLSGWSFQNIEREIIPTSGVSIAK
jgi:hypothetical protein